MKNKVLFLTSREIGTKCQEWLRDSYNILYKNDIILTYDKNDCNVIISVLYDTILKPAFIEGKRCYNFHPGILPQYRGASTFSWSIVNEEKEVGITLHEMDSGIDSGNIIAIERFTCTSNDTAVSLFKRGEEIIYKMFTEWFIKIVTNNYTSTIQDEEKAKLYYRKDMEKIKNISKFIRAFHFPGKEDAFFYNKENKKIHVKY